LLFNESVANSLLTPLFNNTRNDVLLKLTSSPFLLSQQQAVAVYSWWITQWKNYVLTQKGFSNSNGYSNVQHYSILQFYNASLSPSLKTLYPKVFQHQPEVSLFFQQTGESLLIDFDSVSKAIFAYSTNTSRVSNDLAVCKSGNFSNLSIVMNIQQQTQLCTYLLKNTVLNFVEPQVYPFLFTTQTVDTLLFSSLYGALNVKQLNFPTGIISTNVPLWCPILCDLSDSVDDPNGNWGNGGVYKTGKNNHSEV
jgi:hypothetical protein